MCPITGLAKSNDIVSKCWQTAKGIPWVEEALGTRPHCPMRGSARRVEGLAAVVVGGLGHRGVGVTIPGQTGHGSYHAIR